MNFAAAADLPLQVETHTQIHAKRPVKPKKAVAQPKKAKSKPPVLASVPALTDPIIKSTTPVQADSSTPANPPVVPAETDSPEPANVYVSWVLDPLVANADGGKNEGSASARVKIVVGNPGAPYGPNMVITLDGHVIKTEHSTVRLDIQIGSVRRTVVWNEGEVMSGKFKIALNEVVPAGVMPDAIDASAIALVTKQGDGQVAMVSLEKVVLKRGKSQIIGAK